MAENQTLRNLLRSLANFIGEGAGGLLPKLGWGLSDFNEFINKSETDTAWEGYQRRKKPGNEEGESGSSLPPMAIPPSGKRPSETDMGNRAKKMRPDNTLEPSNNFSLLIPIPNSSIPSSTGLYSNPSSRLPERNSLFTDMLRPSNGSPMFMQTPSSTSSQYPPNGSNLEGFQSSSSYISGVGTNIDQPVSSSSPYDSPSSAPISHQRMQSTNDGPAASDELEEEDDPKKTEAYKLIQWAVSDSLAM